jgi:hypothetical protein
LPSIAATPALSWKGPVAEKGRCLTIFRSDNVFKVALALKAFLNPGSRPTHGAALAVNRHKLVIRHKKKAEKLRNARQRLKEERKKNKKHAEHLRVAQRYIQGKKKRSARKDQEIFQLKNELRAAKEKLESASDNRAAAQMAVGSTTGALPDFVIIGAMRCGTSALYAILSQHQHVERAATKELHYFDRFFEQGIDWYSRCFPAPKWIDGRRSITGEATPKYLPDPSVPERMAQVIPQARLIVLLRNPIDRAYSHYRHELSHIGETRGFEEAIIEAEKTQPHDPFGYLSRGIYVDQLVSWSKFFNEEQMLVLKSEHFFERPQETLKLVLGFLDLPDWESPFSRPPQNRGYYRRKNYKMDPDIRLRLQEYFRPHNQRLYEYLGVDFGW